MHILVAYDKSNAARKALMLAQTHAKPFCARIEVVIVMPQSRELGYRDIQVMEYELKREVQKLIGDNTPHVTHLILSDLSSGEELVEFAQENEIGEIIMGLTKSSKLGKFLFGSTAQYVILNASCPVVTVK